MNGSRPAEGERELPLVRGRVLIFRPPARIAMAAARRSPRFANRFAEVNVERLECAADRDADVPKRSHEAQA